MFSLAPGAALLLYSTFPARLPVRPAHQWQHSPNTVSSAVHCNRYGCCCAVLADCLSSLPCCGRLRCDKKPSCSASCQTESVLCQQCRPTRISHQRPGLLTISSSFTNASNCREAVIPEANTQYRVRIFVVITPVLPVVLQ